MKKKVRYIRPGFGRETVESRRRQRVVLALTAIELFLLLVAVLLVADMAGGAGL